MNKLLLATANTRFAGRLASLRSLGGFGDPRTVSGTAAAFASAGVPDGASVRGVSHVSFTAKDDDLAAGLDCVAGSEFLDDRIRYTE